MGNCIPTHRDHVRQLCDQQIYAAMQSCVQPVAPNLSYDELVVAEANRRIEEEKRREIALAEKKRFEEDVAEKIALAKNPNHVTRAIVEARRMDTKRVLGEIDEIIAHSVNIYEYPSMMRKNIEDALYMKTYEKKCVPIAHNTRTITRELSEIENMIQTAYHVEFNNIRSRGLDRIRLDIHKLIEKIETTQKVNEKRKLESIQFELMRPAREAQYKANAERLALEKLEYVSKLEENFKNKFDYETLDKYARAEECSKYTKFNAEFNKLLKDSYVIYHANPHHGFYQYLVMYHAVLRCNSSEGGARQWLYDSVIRD